LKYILHFSTYERVLLNIFPKFESCVVTLFVICRSGAIEQPVSTLLFFIVCTVSQRFWIMNYFCVLYCFGCLWVQVVVVLLWNQILGLGFLYFKYLCLYIESLQLDARKSRPCCCNYFSLPVDAKETVFHFRMPCILYIYHTNLLKKRQCFSATYWKFLVIGSRQCDQTRDNHTDGPSAQNRGTTVLIIIGRIGRIGCSQHNIKFAIISKGVVVGIVDVVVVVATLFSSRAHRSYLPSYPTR